ncbi:MAG: PqqD family protein [Beijerinckiaceae bacterium]|nr:PqqD family protein [Beijerinckiaceae bacterium]
MRLQLTSGTTLTLVEGKSVLFSVKSGDSFGLNETAADMLKIAREEGVAEAAKRLAQEYDAPLEEITNDLQELLAQLVRLKFAQLAPAAQGS